MTTERPLSAPAASPGGDASLSILVVDDEADLREMLTRSFSREGHRVTAVADGRSAIDRASTDHFDIILLDIALGAGPDGYEVCRALRSRRNVVPIIMLTALDSEADAVLGLEAGGDDYVTKPFGLAELRSRIRAVLRRKLKQSMDDPSAIKVHDLVIHPGRHEVLLRGQPVDLTFTEFRLLQFLSRKPGWAFSRGQIVDAVKGEDYPVTERSVDVQVAGLRKKLGDLGSYIETVRGVGYRFKE